MERIIAYHCAPALAGIKPSNIVTCYKNKVVDISKEIVRLNQEMNCKDIYFDPLYEHEKKTLLMVYRKKKLSEALNKKEVRDFLSWWGYPEEGTCEMYIEHLKKRLSKKEFSHEIGVFLGYPLHDIYGFMYHKDEGCLLCGEWKVYDRVEEARELFRRFQVCRSAVVQRVLDGKRLSQLFC